MWRGLGKGGGAGMGLIFQNSVIMGKFKKCRSCCAADAANVTVFLRGGFPEMLKIIDLGRYA
jgi:hypothetical protein